MFSGAWSVVGGRCHCGRWSVVGGCSVDVGFVLRRFVCDFIPYVNQWKLSSVIPEGPDQKL